MSDQLDLVKKQKRQTRRMNNTVRLDHEVAMAWARGEITNAQIIKALGIASDAMIYVKLALAFREIVQNGEIK